MPFRPLELSKIIKGQIGELFLHSMLGRYTKLQDDISEIAARGITTVIRLSSDAETLEKSPSYMKLLKDKKYSWVDHCYPITDFNAPKDMESFKNLINFMVTRLRAGDNILLHCAGGHGRTGMVATAILVKLGIDLEKAIVLVDEKKSCWERQPQYDFLRRYSASV